MNSFWIPKQKKPSYIIDVEEDAVQVENFARKHREERRVRDRWMRRGARDNAYHKVLATKKEEAWYQYKIWFHYYLQKFNPDISLEEERELSKNLKAEFEEMYEDTEDVEL